MCLPVIVILALEIKSNPSITLEACKLSTTMKECLKMCWPGLIRKLMVILPRTRSLSPDAAVTVSACGTMCAWLTQSLRMMLTAAPLSIRAGIS